MQNIGTFYRRLSRAASGNIAVVAAFAMIPILIMVTGGLDFSRHSTVNQEVQAVADAAALNATSTAFNVAKESGVFDVAEIEQVALTSFREQIVNRSWRLEDVQVNVVQNEEGRFEVQLDYEVSFEPVSMVHNDRLTVKGSSEVAGKYGKDTVFMDINLMLDYSASMNTGATIDDQIKMWQNPEIGCAFACHRGMNDEARADGIKLRVDALQDALRVMMNSAEDAIADLNLDPEAAQFSMFTFTNGRLSTRTTNQTDIAAVRRSVGQLPTYPSGRSHIYQSIRSMATRLQPSGTGQAADDRKSFVFMVTDGVSRYGPRNYIGWAGGGILSSDCQRIKDTGATLAVIYTKYENYADSFAAAFDDPSTVNQTPYNRHEWNRSRWRSHFNGGFNRRGDGLAVIKSSLRNCASPDFFFETSNSTELEAAMVEFFEKAIEETKEAVRIVS